MKGHIARLLQHIVDAHRLAGCQHLPWDALVERESALRALAVPDQISLEEASRFVNQPNAKIGAWVEPLGDHLDGSLDQRFDAAHRRAGCGNRVQHGQFIHLAQQQLGGLARLGDLVVQADEVLDLAVSAEQRRDGLQLGVDTPIFAAVGDLTVPGLPCQDGIPHLAVKGGVVMSRLEQAGEAAHNLVRRITGDAGKGLVDPLDVSVGVGDHYARRKVIEDAARQIGRQIHIF